MLVTLAASVSMIQANLLLSTAGKASDSFVSIDPMRFPYAPDTFYRPLPGETGTATQLGHVLDAHGVRHALLVGPNSGYGLDNSCMLDTIA